jgi:hypothetical protein
MEGAKESGARGPCFTVLEAGGVLERAGLDKHTPFYEMVNRKEFSRRSGG